MDSQKDLAWKMRGILTDWLIQVHTRFRLLPETLYLAVNIIDRFLSARVVSLAKLQLVGITCMFLAAKVEEIVAPSAMNFLYCADSSYTEAEILQAEKYILKTLEWNMNYPNPIHFLRRVSKADEYNVQARTVAKYFLEIECVEWRLIAAPPSLLAAASMWLARFVLGKEDWVCHYQCAFCAVGMTFPLLDAEPGTLFFLCRECNNSDGQLDDQLCLETSQAFILLQEVCSKEIYEGTVFLSSLSCRVD
jgi:Cyclin, N-terminal domain/Cyclin, C-terminal domain